MALRYVILTLLNESPRTGYEIVKSFEDSVGYFWTASHQQVYRELSTLTDKALVTFEEQAQSGKPDKKIYQISATGQAALLEWLETPLKPAPTRETILVKLLGASRENSESLLAEIDSQTDRTIQRLATYREIEQQHYKPPPDASQPVIEQMLHLALRRGIIGAEANMAWLQEARSTIEALAND